MSSEPKAELRYKPVPCKFLEKEVQGILVQQPDNSWRLSNCNDKDRDCFKLSCAFTTDGGEWPFPGSPNDSITPD